MTKKATDQRMHEMMGLAEPATLEDRIRAGFLALEDADELFAERLVALIWRLFSRPLHLRRFHPPGQLVSKARKRALQGLAALADRLALG